MLERGKSVAGQHRAVHHGDRSGSDRLLLQGAPGNLQGMGNCRFQETGISWSRGVHHGNLVSLAQSGYAITLDLLSKVDLENVKPLVMDGLDALLDKKKRLPKTNEPDTNGSSHHQQSPSAGWFSSKSSKKVPLSSVTSVIDGLKRLYIQKLKPLGVTYRFNDFVSPFLTNSDFDAKPMVMLLGQYSTGKITFIRHLLKSSYPGAHIGPERLIDL